MNYLINSLQPEDWDAMRVIYEAGIASGQATFETAAPEWEAWDAAHRPDCRLAARQEGQLIGWAALSPVSRRYVYRGVAEVSVYVAPEWHGRGVGKALLQALVVAAEEAGVWTLQATIFPENQASVALHLACGFRFVGRREALGQQHGRWRDVVLLERRSAVTGK
jgi:phosphinothricin acetyltransferase